MTSWMRQVFLMELRQLITYRADFWVNFFGQTFFSLTIAFYLWDSIFTYTQNDQMQGYTIQGMIFYYLIAPLIFRIQQGAGIGFFSREIYDGRLNKYLIYPIDATIYKFISYLAYSSFYLSQLFIILCLYQIFFLDETVFQFSWLGLLFFLVAMLLACAMFFLLFCLTELLAFWFDNVWSLGVILRFISSFLGGGLIPLAFFPAWSQQLLAMTPFPYMIDFPLSCLRGELSLAQFFENCALSIGWGLIFGFLTVILWKRGLYRYTGVGI